MDSYQHLCQNAKWVDTKAELLTRRESYCHYVHNIGMFNMATFVQCDTCCYYCSYHISDVYESCNNSDSLSAALVAQYFFSYLLMATVAHVPHYSFLFVSK